MTASRRRGFTLVELLVVTGLMASLLGLLAAGLRPTAASHVRQLSQSLSSAILASQTQAIGNDNGAALIFEVTGSNATNTIFNADNLPFAVGTVASGMPPLVLSVSSTEVTLTLTNADPADLATGYRIRFSGTAPAIPPTAWLGFSSSGAAASGTVSLRSGVSQTSDNTVWPVSPAGSSLRFEIARRPVKSSPAADVTKFAAIDLRYSGIGNSSGDYGTLAGSGSIGITFDRTGALENVILYGKPHVAPVTPTAPLYLLLATIADIETNTSLRSQTSRWLAIAPGTGRVNVAANVSVTGTMPADVLDARANARRVVTAGVK